MPQIQTQLKSWQKTNLGDFVVFNYGKGLPEGDRIPGPYPVYGSAGEVGTHDEYVIEGPGIIVGRKGSVGKIYYTDKNYFPIDTVYYITKGEKYNLRFLYYLLQTIDFKSLNSDAAVPGLNRNTAYAQEVLLPPLPIQKQIADVLSAYDDLIENNTKRIKILEEIAQAIYKEWFVYFRFPGHEKIRMVDSKTEFDKIPEGWEILQVAALVERVSPGKLYDNKTASAIGKVPILDQGKSGIIGYHNDNPGVEASIENPIIVFANHTCYQRLILFPFSAIQNVLPFYPSEEKHRNIFWLHYATKDVIEFNDYKGHWPEFMQKEVLVPSVELAEKFGNEIKPLVVLSYRLELENQNLRQARDLLLPKLIGGEIEIKQK